jgi:hypothetical protein
MPEMQWVDGQGSSAGHARELCADVDERPAMCGMRQYRRSLDPSSSEGSAHSESETAYDTSCKNGDPTGSGSIIRRWYCKTTQIEKLTVSK